MYQQQLLQTQKMCVEQQKMMNTLASSMDKLQKTVQKQRRTENRASTSREISDSEDSSESDQEKQYESGEISSSGESDTEASSAKKRKVTLSSSDRKKDKLKSLEKSFGKEANLGQPIDTELAKMINKGLGSTLDHKSETIKSLLNKYERPENCEYLDIPKVARSIWTSRQTAKNIKDSDKLLQRTQMYLTKGLVPLVGIMNKTFHGESEESEETFDMAVDVFSLLAHSHRDLSYQRKRMLMPAISAKYKGLCGDSTAITATQLFGEDLSEQIKDIDESGKISNKLTNKWSKKGQKSDHKESDTSNKFGGHFKYGTKKQYGYKNSFLSKKGPRYQNKHHKKGNTGHHSK